MIKAIKVEAEDSFSIKVTLEDGRVVRHDMAYLKDQSGPVVDELKDLSEFKKAFIANGIITWPSGYDIDPYFLSENSKVISQAS